MSPGDDPPPAPARIRIGVGAAIVVVLIAVAVTIGIGVVRGATTPIESVSIDADPTALPEPSAVADTVYVHVSGAVVSPGLYVLTPGSRVVDAVASAGGFADDADQAAVNLARPLGDGEQLHVPLVGEAPVVSANGGAAAPDGKINLNTADAAALDTLPRIGEAMAARIIAWRDENEGFTSVEDLLAVPGIGDKMLAALRDLVTI